MKGPLIAPWGAFLLAWGIGWGVGIHGVHATPTVPPPPSQLISIQQDLHAAENQQQSHQDALKKLQQALEKTEMRIAELHGHIQRLQSEHQHAQQQQALGHVAIQQVTQRIRAHAQQLETLAAAYLRFKMPIHPVPWMAPVPHGPALSHQLQRKILYQLQCAQTTQWQSLQTAHAQLHQAWAEQTAVQQALATLIAEKKDQLQALHHAQEARNTIRQALQKTQQATQVRIKQLRSDEQALQRLLAAPPVPAPAPAPVPFLQAHTLPFPVQLPPATRPMALNSGVFFPVPEGTPVYAVAPGRVVFADYFRHWGFLVIADHGQGWMSLYAHNQRLLVQEGDPITPQTPIAGAGNSGGRKGTGLYFEIRHHGTAQNAWNHLKAHASSR